MIYITEAASRKIANAISKRGSGIGIRIGVKTTGCSGMAYTLEYIDAATPELLVFAEHGQTVFVDPQHYVYLKEMTLDFVRNGLNEGFAFNNPNSRDVCGCGESFRV